MTLTSHNSFDQEADAAAGDAPRLAALARSAATKGRPERAYPLAVEARALAPHDHEIDSLTHEAFTGAVPSWHFQIIVDDRRNAAYEAAITRAVTPGARVLDIGSGTGLLAMIAARAGAGHVFTCESNPAVADVARNIVALNGLSDRITVIAKRSTDIDVEADLGGKVDVLVSEILANDLLSEGVLDVMADAKARLLKPEGRMVPETGEVMVALASLDWLEEGHLRTIAGFDLSPFNALAQYPLRVTASDRSLRLRSEPAALFAFDFTTGGPWTPLRATTDLIATGGRANGILVWMRFQLDEKTSYEVTPGRSSSWATLFHPFDTAIAPDIGESVRVAGAHDHLSVRVWPDQG